MKIAHIGLTASSEEKADRFYNQILCLKKAPPKIVKASIAKSLFNLNSAITYINYFNDNIRFEIFILPDLKEELSPNHVCLEVEDKESFLNKCSTSGVTIKRLVKEDKEVIFISDFDGHLFEIKEAQSRAKPDSSISRNEFEVKY